MTLARDLGILVLYTALGAGLGGAGGCALEYKDRASYEEQRKENPAVMQREYKIDRARVAGGAILGGALGLSFALFGRKRERGERNINR